LGLVAVGQADSIASLCETGDNVIVDGTAGIVHLRPSEDIRASFEDKVKLSAKRQAQFAASRDKPSVTKDGVDITLLHNAGLVTDIAALEETGAAGVGLFRTELQFMIASKLPRLGEQVELYREVMDDAGAHPVVFRLLDIGGDKVVPYMRAASEENPAMGWRSLRLALDRPGLLRTQVRALLKAADGRHLKILVPMVTEVAEYFQARAVIDKEVARLERSGEKVPVKLELGAMIEVPSLLFELDELLPECDFVSIGSNDLVQFLTATDRANPRVARNYDSIARARLRALKLVVDATARHGVSLTMCGELAGRPIEALALLSIGMTQLSMGASSVGPVKDMILALELAPFKAAMERALQPGAGEQNIRSMLRGMAKRQNLPL
jgi:phosphotransferase system enzyme I (PtsP)